MTEDDKKRPGLGGEVRDGIRAGIGILAAMKDAIEATIQDLVEGGGDGDRTEAGAEPLKEDEAGDETAKPAVDAVDAAMDAAKARARAAGRHAAERLDVAMREELESLRDEVAELRRRVTALEQRSSTATEG